MAVLACFTASQGLGMSRKTASATPLTPNPSWHTSWFLTVTRWSTRCSLNSSAAFSARCWWNSTVWRWPVGAMVRRMAWESEPLPVPTTETPQGERIQLNLVVLLLCVCGNDVFVLQYRLLLFWVISLLFWPRHVADNWFFLSYWYCVGSNKEKQCLRDTWWCRDSAISLCVLLKSIKGDEKCKFVLANEAEYRCSRGEA